jgi:hypothetical protein
MRNNTWDPRFYADIPWQYRIQGLTGNTIPVLAGSGTPAINKTFEWLLSNARAQTPGAMLFGGSDKLWGTIPLPWRYTSLCEVLVSGDFFVPFLTTHAGTASLPLALPNDRALINLVVFQQFVVSDPTNPVGWIVSNAGRLKIGEF